MCDSGLLASRRGGTGGFWLTRPPDQITVADLIRAVDGTVVDLSKVQTGRTEEWWADTAVRIEMTLASTTLAELAELLAEPSSRPAAS